LTNIVNLSYYYECKVVKILNDVSLKTDEKKKKLEDPKKKI